MQADLRAMIGLALRSLLLPADVARRIVTLDLSRAVLWQALLLVTIAGVLVSALTQGPILNLPLGTATVEVAPFSYAMILGGSLVMLVFALYFTGQMLGGTAQFTAVLTLVIWLEAIAVLIRLMQGVILLVLPQLGGVVALAGLVVLLWCLLNFVAVMHGFDSLWRAALTLLLAVIGITLGLTVILTMIRVTAFGDI